jgi:hypothetical protein
MDGTQVSWRPISAKPETSGKMPVRIGANSQAESGFFMGQIDEVRVWNRAVPASEVLDQYQLGVFNTTGMNAYFDGEIPPPPDENPPAIIAPPDKRVVSADNLTQVALGDPIVADRGDATPTVTSNAPSEGFPVGTTTVTWTAVDESGNLATADQIITVVEPASSSEPIHTFCSLGCDYSGLQAAINSLPETGGKIYVAPGNYSISKTITLKSGTIIEFDDEAKIVFWGNAIPFLKGTAISNVQIIGGNIIVERAGVKALTFISSNEITVTGTKMTMVQGGNSTAFFCVDCSGVYLSDINANSASKFVDITTTSITNDGKSTKIWIQDSTFELATIEGVRVNFSRDVHIMNNTISYTNDNGIDVGRNIDSQVAYNTLISTGRPDGGAIGTDLANYADIVNNYIDTTGRNAIQIYRASNINVGGNTIIDAGAQGMSVITEREPSANIKMISNHIVSPTGFGIYVSHNQGPVEIANNIIQEMPEGTKPIFIGSANGATVVYGNIVS